LELYQIVWWELSSAVELLHGGAPALELCFHFSELEPCQTTHSDVATQMLSLETDEKPMRTIDLSVTEIAEIAANDVDVIKAVEGGASLKHQQRHTTSF